MHNHVLLKPNLIDISQCFLSVSHPPLRRTTASLHWCLNLYATVYLVASYTLLGNYDIIQSYCHSDSYQKILLQYECEAQINNT